MIFEQRRPVKKPPPEPTPVPAAIAMLAAERADMPFGAVGEFLSRRDEPAPPPPPAPFVIEPWTTEERVAAMAAPEPEPRPLDDALAELKRNAGDDDWPEPPGPPIPPSLPLERFVPPPPDWRAEEREREKVEASERATLELARQLQREGS
jgi:hypothetical protein